MSNLYGLTHDVSSGIVELHGSSQRCRTLGIIEYIFLVLSVKWWPYVCDRPKAVERHTSIPPGTLWLKNMS